MPVNIIKVSETSLTNSSSPALSNLPRHIRLMDNIPIEIAYHRSGSPSEDSSTQLLFVAAPGLISDCYRLAKGQTQL